MTAMVDAYMIWNKKLGNLGLDSVVTPSQGMAEGICAEGFLSVHVLDDSPFCQLSNYFLGSYSFRAELPQDNNGVAAALVRQGLIPSTPFLPHVLKLFRTTHLRCPHLAVQPFVKSLCDLHGVP